MVKNIIRHLKIILWNCMVLMSNGEYSCASRYLNHISSRSNIANSQHYHIAAQHYCIQNIKGRWQRMCYSHLSVASCGVMCVVCLGGDTIKSINQQSGAHVELQRNPPHNTDPNVRIFSIRGTPQQMELARQLIDDKIGVSSCWKKFPQAQVPLTLHLP